MSRRAVTSRRADRKVDGSSVIQNKKTSEVEMGKMGAEEASHCPQLPGPSWRCYL